MSAAPRGARWSHRVRAVPVGTAVRFFAVDRDGQEHGPYATAEHARTLPVLSDPRERITP